MFKKLLTLLCILTMPAFMSAGNAPGNPIPFTIGANLVINEGSIE